MNVIICPVRVSLTMTRACVESLQAQDIPVTTYLIDNGTTDGCGPYLRTHEGICVSYLKPKGLTTVWNRALAHSFDQLHLPHVLCVNNDTVLRPDTYRLLLADGGPFVTGVSVDQMDQITTCDVTSKRPHPSFSCFLMRREVWDTIGPFDESMVIYAQDLDYHLRMHQAGIEAVSIAVPFFHEGSGTLKQVNDATREAICKQADSDRETFARKWGCGVGTDEYYAMFIKELSHGRSER